MEIWGIVLAGFGLAIGGVLKGAIGVGAPIIAVPVLALLYNVPVAVAVFTLPNLISNLWQAWSYRRDLRSPALTWRFSAGGAAGALLGTVLLAFLPGDALMVGLSLVVFFYIGLRLFRPNWVLALPLAEKIAASVGFAGGVMQGAGGISAPISVTFVNAMRPERGDFIVTMSVFFGVMAVVQIPTMAALGIMTPAIFGWSLIAALPLFGAMPFGAWLGRRIAKEVFDRLIMLLLALIAFRLLFGALG